MAKKKKIIPIFIPHQGCGHECIFCNQNHITGVDKTREIEGEIEKYLGYFPTKDNIDLAFYGGSFTGLDENIMLAYLRKVQPYIKKGFIESIRISTRPDYISPNILTLLKDHGVQTIELGVQSMVDGVLVKNKRGTSRDEIIKASNMVKASGFNLGLQMMTGMYGSDESKDLYTAFEISRLDPDFVRIYPTMVLPHTELYRLYRNGAYRLTDLDDMVGLVKKLVLIFEAKKINIARIGLYSDGKDQGFIGPFHPATKQLVYSSLYWDILYPFLSDLDVPTLDFFSSAKTMDYLVGYQGSNKIKLEKLGFKPSFKSLNLCEDIFKIQVPDKIIEVSVSKACEKMLGEIYET